jgi:hypothetical protein
MSSSRKSLRVLLLLLCTAAASGAVAQDYQLGRGLNLSDSVTIGGYFSTEYANGDNEEEFKIDDLAVLVYGSVSENISYMVELESVNFYRVDYLNDAEETNFTPAIERLYLDYKFSDYLAVRAGKQITPIGYWNLQPINVLRETTSNPVYSRITYPKFLTGLDFYGYTPFDENLTYHVYLQASEDLDDEYINIQIDEHYGVSVERLFQNGFQMGGSVGTYTEIDNTETTYLQLNAKYDAGRYSIQGEGIINDRDIPDAEDKKLEAVYLQGEYRFSAKHALIARAEYFHDERTVTRDRIGILGYSYRPVFPVSLKIEYQWHSDSADNKVLTSFSVLF